MRKGQGSLAKTKDDVDAAHAAHKEKFDAYIRANSEYAAIASEIRKANDAFRTFILDNVEELPDFVAEYIEAWALEQQPRQRRALELAKASQLATEAEDESRRHWDAVHAEYMATPRPD